MRLTSAALLALATLGAGPALAIEYSTLLAERSQVAFTSRQMGVPVEGLFGKFTTSLVFDPARPEAGHATIEIDLASIDAGSAEANEEVVGKNWFHVKAHPTARFTSSGVKVLGGGRFEVRGPLTLKGRTQEVAAPFSFRADGGNGVFEGIFTLKRLDFAIGEGAWGDTSTVANEVQIKFRFVAAPAAAAGKK